MTERILVTGGAGFIGGHIVDALIAASYDAAVLDNLHTGKLENIHPAARFFSVDLCDADAVQETVATYRPNAVIHQAALADVRGSLANPTLYARVNVIGTLNLLEAARKSGVGKIIFASTGGAIYGDITHLPASEETAPRPLDPYGASKLAGETYLHTYRHNYGLDYCALRYGNVYGPRQDRNGEAGVVAIFTGKMLLGQPVTINGDGTQQRDFVYVGDIARANLLALSRGSGVYNLGTGTGTDVNTIYRKLAELTGYHGVEMHGPAKLGEVQRIYLDARRAAADLGWTPQVSFASGLATTVASFQTQAGRSGAASPQATSPATSGPIRWSR